MIKSEFQKNPIPEEKASFPKESVSLKATISDKASPALDYLRDHFPNVGGRTQDILQSTGLLIKQHPFYSIAGAVVVGMVLGAAMVKPTTRKI
jgi:ElaB/YqjD/DUF883 family membrane-anchored ribosome-binding protein